MLQRPNVDGYGNASHARQGSLRPDSETRTQASHAAVGLQYILCEPIRPVALAVHFNNIHTWQLELPMDKTSLKL